MPLRQSSRSVARNPGFAAIAIFTLGLAIASGTALFTVVNATLLRPLPYGHQERLVIAFEKRRKEGTQTNGVTPADYLDWCAQSHTFRSLTAHDERAFNLTGPDYMSALWWPLYCSAWRCWPALFPLGVLPKSIPFRR